MPIQRTASTVACNLGAWHQTILPLVHCTQPCIRLRSSVFRSSSSYSPRWNNVLTEILFASCCNISSAQEQLDHTVCTPNCMSRRVNLACFALSSDRDRSSHHEQKLVIGSGAGEKVKLLALLSKINLGSTG
jgi:hypothetical protein